MDAKARADMFKPFSGSTRGSSGLGLSIARDIAVAHGGDLRLSRSNAIGSEFRIRLPLSIRVKAAAVGGGEHHRRGRNGMAYRGCNCPAMGVDGCGSISQGK